MNKQTIFLACGHAATVAHTDNEKAIKCIQCNEISLVKPLTKIEYLVSALPQTLPLSLL